MIFRFTIMAAFIGGCGTSEITAEEFPTMYALEQCTVYKRCYRALYDGEYENMSRCQESVADALRSDYEKLYEGCSFSVEQAQNCLDQKSAATCEEHWDDQYTNEIYNACNEQIWDCSAIQ